MHVVHGTSRATGGKGLGPAKARSDTVKRRTVEISEATVALVRRHRVRQLERRLKAGPLWRDGDWVFTNTEGGQLNLSNFISRRFAPALDRAGVRRVRLHDLRDTMATWLLDAGEDPKVVQERLGHKSVVTTLERYDAVTRDRHRRAASALETKVDLRGR